MLQMYLQFKTCSQKHNIYIKKITLNENNALFIDSYLLNYSHSKQIGEIKL